MKLRITENNYNVRVDGLMRVGYTREKAEEIATSEFSPPPAKPKKAAAPKTPKAPKAAKVASENEDAGEGSAAPKVRAKPAAKLKSGILQEDGTVSWDESPKK
ncbi:MAG TPA: hypothetical protein DD435_10310 [Cyanobacteria bacterium UBA8530]|nr:hypothetical protein [Cyanobacteria bacterium UBA8530]